MAVAFLLIAAYSVVDRFVLGVARDNLSNAAFDRAEPLSPAALGIPYANVTLASDGIPLAGWWMPGPVGAAHAKTTVLLVHGYSANRTKPLAHWAPSLHAAGYSLLAFDLRDHGQSGNGPRGLVTYGVDEAHDVLAALAWVRGNAAGLGVDADRIVLYGESMGGAAVLLAAATHPAGLVAVVSDSSYSSFVAQARLDGAKRHYPGFLVDWVVWDMDQLAPSPPTGSRPDDAVAALRVPVLLAHCQDDERIQPVSFHLLEAKAPKASTWFEPCPGGESKDHHGDGWANTGYNATVVAFLAAL